MLREETRAHLCQPRVDAPQPLRDLVGRTIGFNLGAPRFRASQRPYRSSASSAFVADSAKPSDKASRRTRSGRTPGSACKRRRAERRSVQHWWRGRGFIVSQYSRSAVLVIFAASLAAGLFSVACRDGRGGSGTGGTGESGTGGFGGMSTRRTTRFGCLILGHSTVQVTERYADLNTDLFSASALAAMSIDLTPGEARTGTVGYVVATQEVDERAVKS